MLHYFFTNQSQQSIEVSNFLVCLTTINRIQYQKLGSYLDQGSGHQ